MSSRLMAAYGSRRGRAGRTWRILKRRHSNVGGLWRGELGQAIEDRWRETARFWDGGRQKGRLWAAGLFQVLELKCLSVCHLTIWPFDFLNSALLMKH